MSTPFATSPDSGLKGPHTPPRAPTPLAKSSPIGKVSPYFVPENRDQYQKHGYDTTIKPIEFDKKEFLEFLDVEIPEPVPGVSSRGKDTFIQLANSVAKTIGSG
jgi:hypothetical protein